MERIEDTIQMELRTWTIRIGELNLFRSWNFSDGDRQSLLLKHRALSGSLVLENWRDRKPKEFKRIFTLNINTCTKCNFTDGLLLEHPKTKLKCVDINFKYTILNLLKQSLDLTTNLWKKFEWSHNQSTSY
jgi:hypothetical protein